MKYKAIILGDAIEGGRESGELEIGRSFLIFTSPAGEWKMPNHSLQVEVGGTGNRQIFLKSPIANFTICTADASVLSHPELAGKYNLQEQLKESKNTLRNVKIAIFSGIFVAASLIFSLVFFRNNIIHSIASGMPYSLEQQLGKTYIAQIRASGELDSNSVALGELKAKANLLTSHIDPSFDFQIFISKSEDVNAYALPGGFVVFNKGLLKKAKSWEEVMGVMGHELAHVTQHHHSRGVLSQIGWTTMVSYFLGDGGALTDLVFGAAANLEQLSYSRDFEEESDEKGFEYLKKANINPQGMADFFKSLKDLHSHGPDIPEFMSTHPDTDNRIHAMEKNISKLPSGSKYTDLGNYEDFKSKL